MMFLYMGVSEQTIDMTIFSIRDSLIRAILRVRRIQCNYLGIQDLYDCRFGSSRAYLQPELGLLEPLDRELITHYLGIQ